MDNLTPDDVIKLLRLQGIEVDRTTAEGTARAVAAYATRVREFPQPLLQELEPAFVLPITPWPSRRTQ